MKPGSLIGIAGVATGIAIAVITSASASPSARTAAASPDTALLRTIAKNQQQEMKRLDRLTTAIGAASATEHADLRLLTKPFSGMGSIQKILDEICSTEKTIARGPNTTQYVGTCPLPYVFELPLR